MLISLLLFVFKYSTNCCLILSSVQGKQAQFWGHAAFTYDLYRDIVFPFAEGRQLSLCENFKEK